MGINEFGELTTNINFDEINAFLNQNVDDKKLNEKKSKPKANDELWMMSHEFEYTPQYLLLNIDFQWIIMPIYSSFIIHHLFNYTSFPNVFLFEIRWETHVDDVNNVHKLSG